MPDKKRKLSRIPEFETLEEEAEFWDTHDSSEFEDEFEPVELEFVRPLIHRVSADMTAKDVDALYRLSRERGMTMSELAGLWVRERLARELKASGADGLNSDEPKK
jgi:hypothetical protein